jgi:hypothetical protein
VATNEDATLLAVTEKGYGKRTPIREYRRTNRGGKGVRNVRITEKNGPVVTILEVQDDDQIMLISSDGIVIRTRVSDITVRGRATQGVRLIAVTPGSVVTDVARIRREERRPDERDEASGGEAASSVSAETKSRVRVLADQLIEEDELDASGGNGVGSEEDAEDAEEDEDDEDDEEDDEPMNFDDEDSEDDEDDVDDVDDEDEDEDGDEDDGEDEVDEEDEDDR